jgi:hypothetical protein
LAEVEEIVTFWGEINFVELNVGEGGKYIRDANIKFA